MKHIEIIKNPMTDYKDFFITDDFYLYWDANGVELHEGDYIKFSPDAERIYKLYRTTSDQLGTDATNPIWLENGRAYTCQYGIYALTRSDLETAIRVDIGGIKK